MYIQKDNLVQLLLQCSTDRSAIVTTNVPWNKSIQLVSTLPNDDFPHGKIFLYGSYNGVSFQHNLATEDYVQQQIQGAITASY